MILRPTKQRFFSKKLYGYDVETHGQKNKFYCASIYGDDLQKTFYDKEEIIKFFKTKRFQNSYVVCTNLGFDFDATFYRKEDHNFMPLFRNSDRIFEKTYLRDKKFNRDRGKYTKPCTLTFIDTFNYAKISVDRMGKLLKVKKLDKPECLGKIPENNKQKEYLARYNMRDAEISFRFIRLLFDTFQKIGATPKLTIASSAMSLYKNKYLKDRYWTNDEPSLMNIFNSYYGGRTEAFCRGRFKDYIYGDVNSLYPFVMQNKFPDPNTKRYNSINEISYIESFEGCADVDIYCPKMDRPLLPFRYDKKVVYPIGSWRGWYTNVELRKAMEEGYVIKKVYQNIYFKETCRPFYQYVNDLYEMRKKFKKENNPLQLVVKLLMNSLYGKFGEKFTDKDMFIPIPETAEELLRYDDFEIIQEYVKIKFSKTVPKPHCIPIWASYVTAYGRLHMFDLIKRYDPLYMDTDSVITKKSFHDSDELGGLKVEHYIDSGIIVKPKFYAIKDRSWDIKIKGIARGLSFSDFKGILDGDPARYKKFMKFREALRRRMSPNEIIDMEKNLDLEDNKRLWERSFDPKELQHSKPLLFENSKLKPKPLNICITEKLIVGGKT